MSLTYGVVVGTVKDVEDPQGEGRVQVEFPWMEGKHESFWAPVATLMSGKNRGSWFMPEVGDEVLVTFDHGDVNFPYIVGFLWNGQDKPPNEANDLRVRRLKTVSGHILEFDDRPGEERILLTTQGGQQLEMKDTSFPHITLHTKNGHELTMDETPPGSSILIKTKGNQKVELKDMPPSITLQTSMGNSITISDAPPGITISSSTGILNITCLQANVQASTLLNITAPITIFNGVVQTPTLIAQSIVSPLYTPGVGNLFGL